MAAFLSLPAAALGQSPGNPPELQKALQAAADSFKRKNAGPVVLTGGAVGPRLLLVNFDPAPGVERSLALKSMKETAWDRGICANKDVLTVMNKWGVTIRITLSQAGQAAETVADVTATSCAREASIEAGVSKMIGGVAFAPRPTKDQALALVQAYVAANFFDPDAAKIKCGDPGPAAWVKPMLGRRRYGYFVQCSINGKNRFGGYVGFQTFTFRINGDEFESMDMDTLTAGRMEPAQ
ncbi:hypothetical protein M9979_13215 [Sphingomonas sp. RP10(2022)]|uniref:Uncharacterized protein n=1 Tax=Sphingomonas liriopis TaxID=2949094 RepID=A0A9X2KQK3_9SPHN|nr:hypothetical protein [Sphingomonas liriopis]MCP3735834.1 hypothetical protein [Sphingomonas liriopis]